MKRFFQRLSSAIKQLPVGRFVVLEGCFLAVLLLLRLAAASRREASEFHGKLAEEAMGTAFSSASRDLFNASWARSAELYEQGEVLDMLSWIPALALVVVAWIWFGRRSASANSHSSAAT